MSADTAIEMKMAEVNDIATRLGVGQYVGTDRMSAVEAIVAEWAVASEGADLLGSESLWLDAKNEIERILSDMSLTQNSKHDLFLLGAAQSGVIPLQEVTEGLVEGWNKLLSIHATALEVMSDHDLRTIDRARDKALSMVPAFGTIEDKQRAIINSKQALEALEKTLIAASKGAESVAMKGEIASRMTTKEMILAEAKSAKKQSLIPYGDYQQIENLLGNGGIFSEQMSSIKEFSNDPKIILDQMDRVLDKAMSLLNREASQTTLAGGMFVSSGRQHRISQLGSTHNSGDGMRISGMENANYRGPTPQGAQSSGAFAISPFDSRSPNTHLVTNENHSSKQHKAAGKLAAMHAKKNEALYKSPFKTAGVVSNNPTHASVVTLGLGALGFHTLYKMFAVRQKFKYAERRDKRRSKKPISVADWSEPISDSPMASDL